MRKRRAQTRDPSERYFDIVDKLCEQGRFVRKTGRDWYLHTDKTQMPDQEVDALILSEAARKSIAQSADAIDVVVINGYGFQRWCGGPMFMHADP